MNEEEITKRVFGGLENLEPLDPNRLKAIRDRIAADAAPVKLLPSNLTLIGLLTAFFVAFSLLAAYIVRMLGLHVLTPVQMAFYFGLILLCAVGGAAVVVGEMIPGSRLRSRRRTWIVSTAVILPLTCVALFSSYDTRRFMHYGLPCFEIGSAVALITGLLLSLFLRKGFLASQRSAARVTGFFAALAGVAVLALHCPLLSVAHIFVWHFGVLLVGWLVGDLVGRRLETR